MEEPRMPVVREIMMRDPVVVSPDASVREAARLMGQYDIGCVVVCREDSVEGIFTERDVLRQAAAGSPWETTPVARCMTPKPVTVAPEEPLPSAIDQMERTRVRHLPVMEEGRLVGIISMRDLLRHRARFLEYLVREQTSELETKNRILQDQDRVMQHHLEIAGRVQRQMLPPARYDLPPLSLAVGYYPLDRVSGDYYDLEVLSPDRLAIVIADASGHSIPAALVSAVAKTVFYAYGRTNESPAVVLRKINDHLLNLIEGEHFVTMFYAVVDRRTLRLTCATAGHPPPYWHRPHAGAGGTVETLDLRGNVLGMVPEPTFEEHTLQLEPGDALLFYTDGVTECRNDRGEFFGRKRVGEFLQSLGGVSSAALVQGLHVELTRFRGSSPFEDDVTFVALSISE